MRTHTHVHKNSPTITPPSLLYFLSPSCFSMLSLSLEKLVTCGVIRSYNLFYFYVLKGPTGYCNMLQGINIKIILCHSCFWWATGQSAWVDAGAMSGKTSSTTSYPNCGVLSEWMSKFESSWVRCWWEIWPTWNRQRMAFYTVWVGSEPLPLFTRCSLSGQCKSRDPVWRAF